MKKLTSLLLFVTIVLSTLLTACASDTTPPAMTERVTNVYRTEYVDIPEGAYSNGAAFTADGRVYISCTKSNSYTDDNGEYVYENKNILFSVDLDGNDPREEELPDFGDGYMSSFCMAPDGSRVYAVQVYDMETMMSSNKLIKTDADGNEIFSVNPETMISSENADPMMAGSFYINGMTCGEDGNIYMLSSSGVLAISPSGEKAFELTMPNTYIDRLSASPSGEKILVSYYDQATSGNVYRYIDTDARDWGEEVKLPSTGGDSYSNEIVFGDGYDVYIKNTASLLGYNMGDAEATELANWINSDIMPDEVSTPLIFSKDKLAYVLNSYASADSKTQLVFLTRIPDEEVTAKYLIRVAVMDYMGSRAISSQVVRFNRLSEKYRIVIEDYLTEIDPAAGISLDGGFERLDKEIASGKIPDIIALGSGAVSGKIESYENKGLFADIYEYIDADDDISRDDLLKCVRSPFESDGKLLKAVTKFAVTTLAGKTSNLKDVEDDWSLDTMLEFAQSLPEGKTLLADADRMSMLMIFAIVGLDEFIDRDTKECRFDSDSFIKLLEYAKTLPAEIDYNEIMNSSNRYSKQRNDEVMLENVNFTSFSDYAKMKFSFGTDDMSMIGFPGSRGNSIVVPQQSFAISAKSADEVKAGAWEFVKYLLTDLSAYDTSSPMMGAYYYEIPSTYKGLDALAEAQKKVGFVYYDNGGESMTMYQTLDDGTEISGGGAMISMAGDGTFMQPEDSAEVRLTDEDINFVKDYLDTITSSITYDQQMISMITEEAMPYFDGQKTAADAAKIIQSRVSIYVNESK